MYSKEDPHALLLQLWLCVYCYILDEVETFF